MSLKREDGDIIGIAIRGDVALPLEIAQLLAKIHRATAVDILSLCASHAAQEPVE